MIDWLVVLGVPAVLGAGAIVHAWAAAALERRRRDLERRFGGRINLVRVASASFLGRMGAPLPGQGPGTLALTREVLHFEPLLGSGTFQLPVDALLSVETPRTFRNTFVFTALLVVRFRDGDGREDAVGFALEDVPSWRAALERTRAGRRRRSE